MSLIQETISGAKWSTISQFGRQGLGFVVTAILVRLLSPDAYGLLGMAIVVTGFIAIFKDMGTSSALIQRKEISDNLISSIFWINVLFGLLSAGVVIAIAPWIASFYRESQVVPLLRVLSLSFIISSLSITQQALLTRQMAFNKLARIELTSEIVGAAVGIGMAVSGMGVWSLVGKALCQSLAITILLWVVSPWCPQPRLDWGELRSVTSYSLNLSGFNIFNYFVRNADNILIGRYLGTTVLGHYSLAYRLMLYPLGTVSSVLGRVLFPAFVQMQDDNARFRQAYLRVCASISAISFPMMLGLLIIAKPFVAAIFGPQWMPASTLLIILAPVGMFQSIGTTVGHIYTAKGRTDWMFRWGIFSGIVTVSFFIIGLRWGVVGVAAAYALRTVLLTLPGYLIPFKLIELPIRDFAVALWPTLRASLVMAGSVMMLKGALIWLGIVQPIVVLAITVPVALLIYGGIMLWSRPPALQDLARLLPSRGFQTRDCTESGE